MGVVECISPPMCGSHWWIIHTQVHWWISYIRTVNYVFGTTFQISSNASDIRNLFPTCVKETWVPSWIDAILIWYHYIVICTLVTIFNWWLSSKDMKLQVLIKEVLIIFHLLTFRILLLCSLASGHRALFLVQETTQELLYIYIYLHIYVYIYIYIVEHKVSSITSEPTQSSSRRVSSLRTH